MKRPASHLVGALLLLAAPAVAAEWTEIPYDPPVGSRWIVEAQSNAEESQQATTRTTVIRSRAEMTIEAKTADGFRIAYVTRDISIDGTAPGVRIMQPVLGAFRDVVIRARTDRTGTPVEIENLDEVKASMRNVVAGVIAPFADKPELAEVMKRTFDAVFLVDGKRAAQAYLEELSGLALAQSTGLRPGEERRTSDELPSPLPGRAIKTNGALRIAAADAATGKVRFQRDLTFDPDATKAFALDLARQFLGAVSGAEASEAAKALDEIARNISLSMQQRSEIEVENGITRTVTTTGTNVVSAAGMTFLKREQKTVTVTEVK